MKFENSYEKQALHLLVGLNQEGYQEIIRYTIGFKETTILWQEALLDIKRCSVEKVDIFVSDGFVGIESVIMSVYPNSRIQRCTVHLLRNLKAKLAQKIQHQYWLISLSYSGYQIKQYLTNN